jgi:predicted FMN-binding regulatory protein PaiB
MSYCCGCHHGHHHWYHPVWFEPAPPPSWHSGALEGEGYVRRLEEERDLLERRLRQLEQEVAALRQATRPTG